MTEKITQGNELEPIWEAAIAGDWDTVKEWLKRDPSLINTPGVVHHFNVSLLHHAIDPLPRKRYPEKPDIELVKYLISMGADVNVQFEGDDINLKFGTPPPLHSAFERGNFERGNFEVLQFLISQGVDVNTRDQKRGDTVMHLAAHNSFDIEIFEYLVSAGADVNAKNNLGETPLGIVINYASPEVNILKYLIAQGADIQPLTDEVNDIESQIEELEERLDILREAMGRE